MFCFQHTHTFFYSLIYPFIHFKRGGMQQTSVVLPRIHFYTDSTILTFFGGIIPSHSFSMFFRRGEGGGWTCDSGLEICTIYSPGHCNRSEMVSSQAKPMQCILTLTEAVDSEAIRPLLLGVTWSKSSLEILAAIFLPVGTPK